MDPRCLVDTLVTVGERYSTNTQNLRSLALKVMTLAFKFVDRRSLWESLFGADEYVDWPLVERLTRGNVLGDVSVWLGLLGMCRWECLQSLEGEITLSHPPIHTLRSLFRRHGLDPGGAEGWTMVCRAYILTLVRDTPGLHALDLLTCQHFKRVTRSACMGVLSDQTDTPYTPEQHEATLAFVLTHTQVDTKTLEQNLQVLRASKEDRRLNLQLKSLTVVQGRPRLRDRATPSEETKTNADIELQTWESYKGFNYKHSFPPTLSEGVKSKLYFMAAQTGWPWREHLGSVLQSAPINARVATHPVSRPDVPILIQVIEGLTMDGQAPFPELTDFRAKCFQSFPVSLVQTMTLTQALRLYVAAYQPPSVWKEIWKHLVGVISVQIIRDVENFATENQFAARSVMRLLCRD